MKELITLDGEIRYITYIGSDLGNGIFFAKDNWNNPRIVGKLWDCVPPTAPDVESVWIEFDPNDENWNNRIKGYKIYPEIKMNEKVKEVLQRIDNRDGAELKDWNCPYHKKQIHLVLLNQGGYDATFACLICVKELITEIDLEIISLI